MRFAARISCGRYPNARKRSIVDPSAFAALCTGAYAAFWSGLFAPIKREAMVNHTDKRIVKLWDKGIRDLQTIAKKIGRPNDTDRVTAALIRAGRVPDLTPSFEVKN